MNSCVYFCILSANLFLTALVFGRTIGPLEISALNPGITRQEIESTLGEKAVSEGFFPEWRDRRWVAHLFGASSPAQLMVFKDQAFCDEAQDRWLVVELDGADCLRSVFSVDMDLNPDTIEFRWPPRGFYEQSVRAIRPGDGIEAVQKKLGYRRPKDYHLVASGRYGVVFEYRVRGASVCLEVDGATGRIIGLDLTYPGLGNDLDFGQDPLETDCFSCPEFSFKSSEPLVSIPPEL